MKILLCSVVFCYFLSCQKMKKEKELLIAGITQKEEVTVHEVIYGSNVSNNNEFYEGYSTKDSKSIGKNQINGLANVLNDSSNYVLSNNKNCVLVASYGLKVKIDANAYIIFIGKNPCTKILILNEQNKTEKILDLKGNNTIIPYFDSLFKK